MNRAHILVRNETVASMWDEMQALLKEHYDEIAQDKDAFPLAPDRGRYEAMEKYGKLLVLSCRAEGVLIGYSCFFVVPHIHYKNSVVGSNDVLFISKEFRGTRAGGMLIVESERQLKALGAVKITWHIKPEMDWSASLLRHGYEEVETIYGKLL